MKYQTKHRNELLLFFQEHQDEHLSMSDLQERLPNIPLATLYRLTDRFIEEGLVRKYIIEPNSSCCFQYNGEACHQHFHLICEKCGKLIHLECDEVEHLLNHIQDEHGFAVDLRKINLYGLCEECREMNNQ